MLEINNLTSNDIDEEFLKETVQKVLSQEQEEGKISLAVVGENRIRKLNKRYRGKNKVTDVLSFPEQEVKIDEFKIGPKKETDDLGEIVICLKRVKKNARRNDKDVREELTLVLIHGVLHLLGYDHKEEGEAQEMEKIQKQYLNKVL
ncbi:MAG: rRNA maturation RNase YbeY [Candidatus Paceibacterota bacterium]